jgi:hypothetical protein
MQLTTNEIGKPFWIGVEEGSLILEENFYEVDMWYNFLDNSGKEPDSQWAFHCNIGSITVLDRMTGFSFGRDTETGFRDIGDKFWLASGMFDIREYLPMSFVDAVELIKANANNCKGGDDDIT